MRQKCETKENIEGGQGNNVNPFHAGLSSKRDPCRFFRGAEWPDARVLKSRCRYFSFSGNTVKRADAILESSLESVCLRRAFISRAATGSNATETRRNFRTLFLSAPRSHPFKATRYISDL